MEIKLQPTGLIKSFGDLKVGDVYTTTSARRDADYTYLVVDAWSAYGLTPQTGFTYCMILSVGGDQLLAEDLLQLRGWDSNATFAQGRHTYLGSVLPGLSRGG